MNVRDPLVALGIRLLGPPADLPDEDLERGEEFAGRALKALDEKKEMLRLLAPTDNRAAAELQEILNDEIEQLDANISWMRRFRSTDESSPAVKAQTMLELEVAKRQAEVQWCAAYLP